jgi:hypothetical protein
MIIKCERMNRAQTDTVVKIVEGFGEIADRAEVAANANEVAVDFAMLKRELDAIVSEAKLALVLVRQLEGELDQ